MLNCLAVGCGGFIGALLRYLFSLLPLNLGREFPIKTLLINIIGSFVIGLIAAFSLKYSELDPRLILFLKVGICGGFTSFSSFALDSYGLLQDGLLSTALIYAVLSVLLSLFALIGAEMLVNGAA